MASRDWADSEYSRLYWSIVGDPKFEDVFFDDRRFAAYVRLLMDAEQAYPAAAVLPRWLDDDVFEALCEVGILEPVGRMAYRVVGLRAEREGRLGGNRIGGRVRATKAERDASGRFLPSETLDDAGERWVNAGTSVAGSSVIQRSSVDETRRDETSRDNPLTPASGGTVGRRANGTSPRQVAKAEQAERDEESRARRYRRSQRQLAYHRGAITEYDRDLMDRTDAPLSAIPDWVEHLASLQAEAEAPSPLDQETEEAWT